MNSVSKKVVIIGAGNLANHFASLLVKRGHEIIQVISRSEESARALGLKLFTTHSTSAVGINSDADIYLICVSDHSIADVAASISVKDKLVLHTSGSTDINVLNKSSNRYGVLYPLQTFSKDVKAKWSKIPLLIEANNPESLEQLQSFASGLCAQVQVMDSTQRLKMHLAAVFASNFSNHLYALAEEFLEKENIGHFELLQPLIIQTAKKLKKISPLDAQTGPAVRGDKNILNAHLAILEKYKTHKQLYQIFTKSIVESTKKNEDEL
jgi:predicted short-subunit dehydrogenase-like oxidoreductase (DUF2520 family)